MKLLGQGVTRVGGYEIFVDLQLCVGLSNFVFIPFSYYPHSESFTTFLGLSLVGWVDSLLPLSVLVPADDVLSVS